MQLFNGSVFSRSVVESENVFGYNSAKSLFKSGNGFNPVYVSQ